MQLDDPSGTLRIARRSRLITAYFLHNGHPQALTSGTNTSPAAIGVSAIGDNIGPSAGSQVVVDVDHFSVTGVDPICPSGSRPSG